MGNNPLKLVSNTMLQNKWRGSHAIWLGYSELPIPSRWFWGVFSLASSWLCLGARRYVSSHRVLTLFQSYHRGAFHNKQDASWSAHCSDELSQEVQDRDNLDHDEFGHKLQRPLPSSARSSIGRQQTTSSQSEIAISTATGGRKDHRGFDGLSSGAKVGIGMGISVVGLGIAVGVIHLARYLLKAPKLSSQCPMQQGLHSPLSPKPVCDPHIYNLPVDHISQRPLAELGWWFLRHVYILSVN